MIIDAHAHLSPTTYGSVENYLEQLGEGGIPQGVICPGAMLDVRRMDEYVAGKSRPNAVPKNEYVDACITSHPRLHGLVCVNPYDSQAQEAVERYLEKGFRGLMISPLVHRFSFLESEVAALASLCGEHGVPIYSHIAFRPGANTADYVQLARQFPKTSFILEHGGIGLADQEATAAAAELDNFFMETSLDSYLHVLETVKKAGASKVIFGSEYPLSHPALELRKILLLPIPEREREQILGGNIRELLHLH